jgi:hypothetical protein
MKVDMSPEAIATRLKRASQLRDLCLSLGKAKLLGPRQASKQSGQEKNDLSEDDISSRDQQGDEESHASD